jgi:hypothetical protein
MMKGISIKRRRPSLQIKVVIGSWIKRQRIRIEDFEFEPVECAIRLFVETT